jgi:GT2 family glycosyltransferase
MNATPPSDALRETQKGRIPAVPYNAQVSVLITHHINENDAYLRACLRSVLASEGIEIETIVISDAPLPPKLDTNPKVNLIWDGKLVGVGDKWKEAIRISDASAPYFISISDDVMVSKHCIAGMAQAIGRQKAIRGPLSNCDNGSRYFAAMPFPRKQTLEALVDERQVIDYPPGQLILLPQDWIGFYCVMLPKSVIDQVGELDARMEVRGNDVDYCYRAKRLGIPSLIHLGVFALHFGDRTIPKVTSEAQYAAADQAMMAKYSGALA